MLQRPAPRRHLPPLGLASALALLAGITVLMGFPELPPAGGFAVACLAGASAWWRGRRALRLAGAFTVGLGLAGLHGHHALAQRIDADVVGVDLEVELRITGLVRQGTVAASGSGRGFTGFDAVLVSVPQVPELEGRRVSLGWYGPAPGLAPGQVWEMQLRLRRPRGVLNPGGFDRERRALEQRLAATGYVRQPDQARLLSDGGGLDAWRSRTSERLGQRVAHPGMRFVLGLSLGDTRQMQPQDWDALRATGLTHLLAISGFHVGVVAGLGALLAGALSRLWPAMTRRLPRPMLMAWTALACAIVYAAAAGFSLPTQRAVLMIAAALLARLARRPVVAANSFALALLAVLLVDPLAVLSPGFWLSFLGVGWLLWCLGGSQGGAKPPGYLGALLGTQWVASVGLLPLTVWFFGQASVVGPLANLLGIPLVTLVVVPLALLGTLLSLAWSAGGEALLWTAATLVEQGARGMRALAQWPGAMRHLPAPGLPALLLALGGAAWLLMPRGTPGRAMALPLFLPLLWPRLPTPAPGGFEIHVIDVGQGLSLLVRTHAHALLYDTGPNAGGGMDMGATAVVPTLHALGVDRLDALVISHGDNDHVGGMPSVLRAFPGTPLWGQAPWLEREPRTTRCAGTMPFSRRAAPRPPGVQVLPGPVLPACNGTGTASSSASSTPRHSSPMSATKAAACCASAARAAAHCSPATSAMSSNVACCACTVTGSAATCWCWATTAAAAPAAPGSWMRLPRTWRSTRPRTRRGSTIPIPTCSSACAKGTCRCRTPEIMDTSGCAWIPARRPPSSAGARCGDASGTKPRPASESWVKL
ncbi:DNA internalization-related competence protein ComEC/Rec2 [Alkalisalibacterium limincola]|uniref:DNA internalization-related competence protein ComEC/Rec2 n=1 Tax=Alkalisalibacterium limincola TaxID=2699169 RepID=A0A5C8KZQ2_9GAMM|nr:DNA internalization-related competence protein ComEC/Rec2 [Alkalisalibacterium limincola]TXK65621.1 DNA internalization-related competence protein ComEC/Rec2 [Alkalisalibacterium limincola]